MSSVKPDESRNQLNGGEERGRELVVAGDNGAESLESAEEPLDQIAFSIESEVGFPFHHTIGFGRYNGGDFALLEDVDKGVSIIGLVRQKGFWFNFFEQGGGLTDVAVLASGE